MSYQTSNLSVLSYANNFTLWHYISTDDAAAITGAGYFDNASEMLRVNDLMIVNSDTDGSPATTFYVVTGNDGGSVTIAAYA